MTVTKKKVKPATPAKKASAKKQAGPVKAPAKNSKPPRVADKKKKTAARATPAVRAAVKKAAPAKAVKKATPAKVVKKAAAPVKAVKKAAPVVVKKAAPVKAAKKAAPVVTKKTVPAKAVQPTPVKKAAATAPAKRPLSKKLPVKTVSTIKPPSPVHSSAPKTAAKTSSSAHKNRFLKKDLDLFKEELLAMRDRITGQSGAMRDAALERNDERNPEEDGTDAFMRLQTLEQVRNQHRDIANIDDALRSIEQGSYGICEMCGELISKQRLAVLPFATNCITCQSEMEKMKNSPRRR